MTVYKVQVQSKRTFKSKIYLIKIIINSMSAYDPENSESAAILTALMKTANPTM